LIKQKLKLTRVKNNGLWSINLLGDVQSLKCDLLNRGQEHLTMYRKWTDMCGYHNLTLTDNVASLPSDFVSIVDVLYRTSANDKKYCSYYENGPANRGYEMQRTGDKDTGYTYSIRFYNTVSLAPTLFYQKRLPDFEDQTDTPQYSYFPGELLLKAAQDIHITETGLTGAEMAVIARAFKARLKEYAAHNEWHTVQLRRKPQDNNGTEIYIDNINLGGNSDYGPSNNSGLSRSYDFRK